MRQPGHLDQDHETQAAQAELVTDLEPIRAAYRRGVEAGRYQCVTGVEPFEATRALVGDEQVAVAMALEPEWVIDMAETYTGLILTYYGHVIDAGFVFDGIWTYGDMAYNHATFCSPAMYRELIWPQHVRLVEFAHKRGMKFIYHTDGNVNGVIDLYLEAGFDCLQPLEAKAGMDVGELAPKYGGRLSFFGNIDVMKLATNDPEVIEEESKTKLAAGMATREYLYHSDHRVPPRVSRETYQHLIALIDRYGRYPDRGPLLLGIAGDVSPEGRGGDFRTRERGVWCERPPGRGVLARRWRGGGGLRRRRGVRVAGRWRL
ncbi:MAG: uroporphyrinogen decarboxylase family protein [Planctomycetota bacterium]